MELCFLVGFKKRLQRRASNTDNFFNSLLIFQFNNNKPFIWSKVPRGSFSEPLRSVYYFCGADRAARVLFRVPNFLKERHGTGLYCSGGKCEHLPSPDTSWRTCVFKGTTAVWRVDNFLHSHSHSSNNNYYYFYYCTGMEPGRERERDRNPLPPPLWYRIYCGDSPQ